MARLSYSREILSAATLPFLIAGMEGSIAGVFIRNTFDGVVDTRLLNAMATLVAASPALANISSPIWKRVLRGTDRARAVGSILLLVMIAVVALSIAPISQAGLFQVVASVIVGRVLWTGFISARSTVWQMNYPRSARGRITGKFATVHVLTIAMLGLVLGQALDTDVRAFRVLLPIGCIVGFVTVWTWLRMRVRNSDRLRRDEQALSMNTATKRSLSMAQILRTDRDYRGYMLAQMLMGLGNLVMIAISPVMIKEAFQSNYTGGITITSTLPLLMMPLSIPIWAKLIDRTHVVRFRAIHSWVFVASLACMTIGYSTHRIEMVYVAALLQGAGFGGGVLAWPLGHMDFAPPERAADYLNVHIALTGLRGLFAPLVAYLVYLLITDVWEFTPSTAAAGVALLCLTLVLSGAIGFVLLVRTGRFTEASRDSAPGPQPKSQTGI